MAGTSAGARKGWQTRRGYLRFGGNPQHTRKRELLTVEEAEHLRKRRERAARTTQPAAPVRKKLVPIGRVPGHAIDPHAPLDPRYLHQIYGAAQLADALDEYTPATLHETAAREGIRPGRSKQETIRRIVEHVTRPPARPAAPAKSSTPVRGQRVRR